MKQSLHPTHAGRCRWLPRLLAALLLAGGGAAQALDVGLDQPALTVAVPGLPPGRLALRHHLAEGHAVASGQAGALAVELDASPAPEAITRSCADNFLRALVKRPGMPDRDSIYRAPLDLQTFVVLYILGEGEARRLHAHLLAAVAGHCVDAHFSRAPQPGEHEDLWRTSFQGATIRGTAP